MALDPATAKLIAKVVISQITDEEKRQRLIIGIITGIVVCTLILLIPLFAITSTIDKIKSFFGFGDDGQALDNDYNYLIEMRSNYSGNLETGELIYNGTFPMPVNNAVVTSEYGSRIHPVTGKQSFQFQETKFVSHHTGYLPEPVHCHLSSRYPAVLLPFAY